MSKQVFLTGVDNKYCVIDPIPLRFSADAVESDGELLTAGAITEIISGSGSGGGGGTVDHSVLINRGIAGQHPMVAISGLSDELSGISANITTSISTHNTNSTSHNDIRTMPDYFTISGVILTSALLGVTSVPKTEFPAGSIFVINKTMVSDNNGTVGVYASDVDTGTISIKTISTSGSGSDINTLIGNVPTHADIPTTVTTAEALWNETPTVGDWLNVLADETLDGALVRWYITAIDGSGNITVGNALVLNTSNYQSQLTSGDAGKVPIGGSIAGEWGISLSIDVTPTAGSGNLVTSGAVNSFVNNKLIISSVDLEDGVSALTSGVLYFVYE